MDEPPGEYSDFVVYIHTCVCMCVCIRTRHYTLYIRTYIVMGGVHSVCDIVEAHTVHMWVPYVCVYCTVCD